MKKLKISEIMVKNNDKRNIFRFYGALKNSKNEIEIIIRKIKERRNEINNEVSKKLWKINKF